MWSQVSANQVQPGRRIWQTPPSRSMTRRLVRGQGPP
jgi:hypothetical protein